MCVFPSRRRSWLTRELNLASVAISPALVKRMQRIPQRHSYMARDEPLSSDLRRSQDAEVAEWILTLFAVFT